MSGACKNGIDLGLLKGKAGIVVNEFGEVEDF